MSEIYYGSDLKLNVSFDPKNNLTMDDVDFECLFIFGKFGNGKRYLVPKSGMVRLDSKNYLACIRSTETTRGNIICEVKVKVPDAHFDNGIRNEVVRCDITEAIV